MGYHTLVYLVQEYSASVHQQTNMKVALALLALAAVAVATPLYYVGPHAYAAPYHPYTYPVVHAAPVVKTYTAQAVVPGYVAKTPGATHTAPLPVGPAGESIGYASHHLNLDAAPGSK